MASPGTVAGVEPLSVKGLETLLSAFKLLGTLHVSCFSHKTKPSKVSGAAAVGSASRLHRPGRICPPEWVAPESPAGHPELRQRAAAIKTFQGPLQVMQRTVFIRYSHLSLQNQVFLKL